MQHGGLARLPLFPAAGPRCGQDGRGDVGVYPGRLGYIHRGSMATRVLGVYMQGIPPTQEPLF